MICYVMLILILIFSDCFSIEICRLKYSYKHFTFFDLLQDGFVKTHAEIFRLTNFEEARRKEAGPKAPLWSKKTLEQQPDKLCMMARRLMQAESAMRMREC